MGFFAQLFSNSPGDKDSSGVGVDLFDEEFLRQLETLALMSRRASSSGSRGDRRSKKRGSGVEFADYRRYVPGDDIRFLDLGIYQRFGKLLVRLFEEEEDLSVYLLVDTSGSMGSGGAAKLNQAAKIAAALSYVALANLDRVSVVSLSQNKVERLPATRGKQRVFRVLRFLGAMKAEGTTDLRSSLQTFVAQNKRPGLAILLTDLYDPQGFEAGMNVLRFSRFEPVVLELFDKRDRAPTTGGDLELRDVETGETREVSVSPKVEKKLRDAYAERDRRIARFCASKSVLHIPVDVMTPFEDVVRRVLTSGGLIR